MSRTLLSVALFVLARLCEIRGGSRSRRTPID
jgi:hypothetical protein